MLVDGDVDGGGGGGGYRGAEGCLYATRALIYRQAPETEKFDHKFCSHYLTIFLKLRINISSSQFTIIFHKCSSLLGMSCEHCHLLYVV